MTQRNFPHAHLSFGASTSSGSIDERVRPNLRRAYPLPAADHGDDDRFPALLEALAHQADRARQTAHGNARAL